MRGLEGSHIILRFVHSKNKHGNTSKQPTGFYEDSAELHVHCLPLCSAESQTQRPVGFIGDTEGENFGLYIVCKENPA